MSSRPLRISKALVASPSAHRANRCSPAWAGEVRIAQALHHVPALRSHIAVAAASPVVTHRHVEKGRSPRPADCTKAAGRPTRTAPRSARCRRPPSHTATQLASTVRAGTRPGAAMAPLSPDAAISDTPRRPTLMNSTSSRRTYSGVLLLLLSEQSKGSPSQMLLSAPA